VALWTFFTPLVKLVSIKSQFLLVTLSFTFTFLTFLIVLGVIHGRDLWRRLRALGGRHVFFGLFGYFFYWQALIQCFREFSSASGSTVLNYTWPVFTVLFTEVIFRRSRKPRLHRLVEWSGIFLGLASVLVLATRGDVLAFEFTHVKGLLWGLAAGGSYGFFGASSGTVPRESHGAFLLAAAGVSVLAMLPFGLSEAGLVGSITARDLVIVAVLGSVFDGMGYFLWTAANRLAREQGVDISAVSSIVFFLPLLSVVGISLIFGEQELWQPYFAVTLVLLISGSMLCQLTGPVSARLRAWFSRPRPE
jgi:drug/metabolite transporter (DMT)-like permease